MKVHDTINKKYGDNAIFLLGQEQSDLVPVIPTGSFSLDVALGVGGIPRGRITEIYGPEGSGKTTICQHLVANTQQMGGHAAFVDVEHALDPHYMSICGVDIENLSLSQPQTGEEALDIVEILIRSGEVDIVVVDSVAALAPRAEIEGEMGDSHMALQARLMSQAMRKLVGIIKNSNVALIFTNQLRQTIGGNTFFGPQEVTSGGNALKYYASVRLDIKRSKAIKYQEEQLGNEVRVTVKKNKVAPPFKTCIFDIYYDEGISYISELIKFGTELGIIKKAGAWFTIGEEKKVQGDQNVRKEIKEDPELYQLLDDQIRLHLGLPLRRYNV